MRLFYEREESVPAEPYAAIAAAGRCKIQRERIRKVREEAEYAADVLFDLHLLDERIKDGVMSAYRDKLASEEAEYARCREVLLELGYDDYV